nr:hypothetical protein fc143 [uncultured bacterium]
MVIVRIHADCVPPGAYSDRLLVYNNDPDENPYPDGVYVDLTVNANPTPSITATPGTTVCEGTPVTLDAGAGYSSYFWLPAGQTTQTIDVTTGGVYSVIVTNANGCHGSDEIGITVNPNPTPTITATPGTNVCEGTTVALDAGPGYASYLWSPAGQTTQTIDVITGGTYSVTVMDTNGCDGSDDIVITVNPNPTPTVMATPGTTVCEEETVTLDAGPGYASYLWSPGGQTTQTIEVTAGGTYSVTVTDANGCQGSDDIVITVNPNPTTPTNAAADPPEICAGDSSTLTATVGGAEIDWYTDSCGGTFIETGNSIEVSPTATTTYYARARHVESGCESPNCGQVTVTVNTPGLGDLNCDCAVDAFDIDPFVLALTDPDGYVAAYPDCDVMLADCNGDGVVDAFDIDPFVELLVGP